MLSSAGYGFFWHEPSIGRATFAPNRTEWHARSTRQLDYWITAGHTPPQIVRAYSAGTGRVPMMPEHGLGFWQCKLRYWNQEQLLEVAREYRRRGLLAFSRDNAPRGSTIPSTWFDARGRAASATAYLCGRVTSGRRGRTFAGRSRPGCRWPSPGSRGGPPASCVRTAGRTARPAATTKSGASGGGVRCPRVVPAPARDDAAVPSGVTVAAPLEVIPVFVSVGTHAELIGVI